VLTICELGAKQNGLTEIFNYLLVSEPCHYLSPPQTVPRKWTRDGGPRKEPLALAVASLQVAPH
jgi:hypothetical protein